MPPPLPAGLPAPNDGVGAFPAPNDVVVEPAPKDGVAEFPAPKDGADEFPAPVPNDVVEVLPPPKDGVDEAPLPNDGVAPVEPNGVGLLDPKPLVPLAPVPPNPDVEDVVLAVFPNPPLWGAPKLAWPVPPKEVLPLAELLAPNVELAGLLLGVPNDCAPVGFVGVEVPKPVVVALVPPKPLLLEPLAPNP